jgi:hypothetical protein
MQTAVAPALAFAPVAIGLVACGNEASRPGDMRGPGDAAPANDGAGRGDAGRGDAGRGDASPLDAGSSCRYPAEATEPMAVGAVLFPYAWPTALPNGSGPRIDLDLRAAHCNDDPDLDWSPFDLLLFVSVPGF